MPKGDKLSVKQALFIDNFIANGGNALQAALQAGYSPKSANATAYEILENPSVVSR